MGIGGIALGDEMTDIEKWLENYCALMLETFGGRVEFIGIQGSRGRGEAREDSDIDIVLILDNVSASDLEKYDGAISALPERGLICGFVSGMGELENWDKADLFQFCYDTRDVFGSLEKLRNSISRKDAARAAHTGACNIYHSLVHNMVHEKSSEILQGLFKHAGFVLRAEYFREEGVYLKTREELINSLDGPEKKIAELGEAERFAKEAERFAREGGRFAREAEKAGKIGGESAEVMVRADFHRLSELLMEWAKGLIERYSQRPAADSQRSAAGLAAEGEF